MGTDPPSRLRKYFGAATRVSGPQTIGIDTVVDPVNEGTGTATFAHRVERSVCAHSSGAPNRNCSRTCSSAVYLRRGVSTCTWQRSAIESIISSAGLFAISSSRAIIGCVPTEAASARTMRKDRSGMGRHSLRNCALLQRVEEPADALPRLFAARKAPPALADEAGKLVALVDRDDVGIASLA